MNVKRKRLIVADGKCPACDGAGWWLDTSGFIDRRDYCEKCKGTGRRDTRAGVGCAALVGASDAESEEPEGWCNPCGTPHGHKCWGHCIGTRIVGTNDMERIAPTDQDHESPEHGGHSK